MDGPVPDVPEAPEEDIRTLLDVLNTVLETELPRTAVAGAYAGLRPLLAADGRTADLSRRHAVLARDGIVTVVGGKLTTYRRMAEDAVDRAVAVRGLRAGPSRTAALPLVGAGPVPAGAHRQAGRAATAPRPAAVQRLVTAHPEPVGLGLTLGDLLWSVRHEGALDADDLLDRRTRIGLVAEDRERAARAALGRIPLKLAPFR